MTEMKDRLAAGRRRSVAFRKEAPELFEGFNQVMAAATRPGRFTPAQKELVAVAMSVLQRCEDCTLFHLDAARRHGAKEAELIELLEVAVEMGGGPAVTHAAKALEIFRAL